MYSKEYYSSLWFTLGHEGGTNSDPDDRGGLTNFGISEKQYPTLDIANLTEETATAIYHQDYWMKNRCQDTVFPVYTILFDTSVNCGAPSGAKWLQQAINTVGGRDISVDGIVGSDTLRELSGLNPWSVSAVVAAYRLKRYTYLIKNYEEQRKYIRGWIDRTANLLLYVSDYTMQNELEFV